MIRRFVFIAFLTGLSLTVPAQDKKFSVSTNLLNLAAAGPSLSFNYIYSPKVSFQVYGAFGKFNNFAGNQYNFKTVIFDTKFTLLKDFFSGLYIGPYLRYIEKRVIRYGDVNRSGFLPLGPRDFRGKGMSSGLLLGMAIPNTKIMHYEAFAGAGYGRFLTQVDYGGREKQNGFLDVRFGVLIGVKL